jgi:hypothetical protein
MTCSWQGASFCAISTGLIGRVSARASLRVRSVGLSQPKYRSTIRMSAKRLVIARACGLPFTLLKSIGRLPSKCFCRPVISRSGSTSLSVSIRSPSVRSHSMALRRLVMSFA